MIRELTCPRCHTRYNLKYFDEKGQEIPNVEGAAAAAQLIDMKTNIAYNLEEGEVFCPKSDCTLLRTHLTFEIKFQRHK